MIDGTILTYTSKKVWGWRQSQYDAAWLVVAFTVLNSGYSISSPGAYALEQVTFYLLLNRFRLEVSHSLVQDSLVFLLKRLLPILSE
jgi:hypothetical protein